MCVRAACVAHGTRRTAACTRCVCSTHTLHACACACTCDMCMCVCRCCARRAAVRARRRARSRLCSASRCMTPLLPTTPYYLFQCLVLGSTPSRCQSLCCRLYRLRLYRCRLYRRRLYRCRLHRHCSPHPPPPCNLSAPSPHPLHTLPAPRAHRLRTRRAPLTTHGLSTPTATGAGHGIRDPAICRRRHCSSSNSSSCP